MGKSFLAVIALMAISFQVRAERNDMKRYWLFSDGLQTDDTIKGKERGFILDVKGAVTKDVMSVYKDVKDAIDSNSTSQQLTTFNKYSGREVVGDGRLILGIPLFLSPYDFGDVKLRPQLKGSFNGGGSLSIQQVQGNINNSAECAQAKILLNNPNLDCAAYLGQVGLEAVPYGQVYWRMDNKVGLNLDFEIDEHWLFTSYLYRMTRKDKYTSISYANINNAKDAIDFKKDSNETVTMNGDFSLGYKNKNLLINASVSEFRFSKSSDHAQETMTSTIFPSGTKIGELQAGNSPFYQFHSQYAFFPLSWLHFKPFAGAMKRAQYELKDGWYVGSDLIFTTSAQWFQLAGTAKWDPYYFTISPRVRLFHFLELSYAGKVPTKSDIDSVKVSAVHSLNLKLRIDY